MKPTPNTNVLSLTAAGKLYDVQPETMLKLAQAGKFKAFKLGKLWRVDQESLERYIESTSTQPGRTNPLA
jgi:excisionase family DNA binding protein